MRIIKAAFTYWAAIFALGFVLGTLRVLWFGPLLGETRAVLVELPAMLAASWFAARWLVRRYAVGTLAEALAMGALAFALLMAAEAVLAITAFGRSPVEWLSDMTRIPGVMGLAGQAVFGLIPVLVRERGKR